MLISDYLRRRDHEPESPYRLDDLRAVRAHLIADAHARGATDEHLRILRRVNARIWSRQ